MGELKSLAFCVFLFAVTICGCSNEDPVENTSFKEARAFIAEHWSVDLLIAAYDPASTDAERAGEGRFYFPFFDPITEVNDLDNLPLWVPQEEDEQAYTGNAANWDQFIFGWDDYLRLSVARPEFDYEPTNTRTDLRQPWVSEYRNEFGQIMDFSEYDPGDR